MSWPCCWPGRGRPRTTAGRRCERLTSATSTRWSWSGGYRRPTPGAPRWRRTRVQLTIQEARPSARLGVARDTHRLLDEDTAAFDRTPTPHDPEHHFVFDPNKLVAYSATTLAWLGDDPALAEEYARRAVAQHEGATHGRWVRRLATARIDLALVLARTGQPAEAAHLGSLALASGRLVPSNVWRVAELDRELTGRYPHAHEVTDFHARYGDTRPQVAGVARPGDGRNTRDEPESR